MDAAVIIAGAGPAGLMLAGELRLAGVEVIVLDRLPAPTGESRGLGFTARTMEVFDQRGLLPRFGELETSTLGHFGGLPIDFSVLDGAHFGAKGIPQARTEAMLGEWAAELGADIRRGHELTALHDTGDGVEVEVDGPDGTIRLRASYLVGCDGGRSTVRKAAGFDFPGTASTAEMFLADVKGCDLKARPIGETVPGGMVMAGPLGGGVDRIIVCERGTPAQRRAEAPSFEEVAAAWQRLTGQDISHGEPLWVSSFGNAARQATEYRRGRVILAGDAAHIHLPAGGQGMNTSIQDAVNLGWKLAAVVNGWAPDGLLDTYHGERHPVGVRLLMNTQAQGLLFLTGDEVQPLREVIAELITYENVSRHLAGMVSGLEITYDVGPGAHPLLGRRLPHQELLVDAGKTSTTELLHPARGVLLDFADDANTRRAAAGWADRVDIVTATAHALAEGSPFAGTDVVLVRPDGHVAWAGAAGAGLTEALGRWFGSAADGGHEGERQDIVRAARTVFAREGFTRAGLDAVAAQAGMEQTTVRAHFTDADELFRSVLVDGAQEVSAALTAIAQRHLGGVTDDVVGALNGFARAWISPIKDFAEHFALVRQIGADVTRLRAGVLGAWQDAGPRPAQRELARLLAQLGERGLIEIGNPGRAADLFILLTSASVVQRSFHGAVPLTEAETDELVTNGVRDFLLIHRPTAAG